MNYPISPQKKISKATNFWRAISPPKQLVYYSIITSLSKPMGWAMGLTKLVGFLKNN